jgi:hypothetical protein
MGRRTRHFSWGAVGASAALDARRITGVSNGANIASWVDISGNGRNFTNSNATRSPIYEATGLNGFPCALSPSRDPALSRGLLITTPLPVGTAGAETQFCVLRFTAAQFQYQLVMANGHSGQDSYGIVSNLADNVLAYGYVKTPPTEVSSADGALSTTVELVDIDGDGSGKRMRRNGVTQTLTNPTTPVNPVRSAIDEPNVLGGPFVGQNLGASIFSDKYNSTMVGRIGMAVWVPYAVPAPLRKRIQHAMAYSYKIPCS